jgi:formate dehydrogenase major subunit
MVNMNRRQFFKVTGATLAGSSLALLGVAPRQVMAEVRQYKLA